MNTYQIEVRADVQVKAVPAPDDETARRYAEEAVQSALNTAFGKEACFIVRAIVIKKK